MFVWVGSVVGVMVVRASVNRGLGVFVVFVRAGGASGPSKQMGRRLRQE